MKLRRIVFFFFCFFSFSGLLFAQVLLKIQVKPGDVYQTSMRLQVQVQPLAKGAKAVQVTTEVPLRQEVQEVDAQGNAHFRTSVAPFTISLNGEPQKKQAGWEVKTLVSPQGKTLSYQSTQKNEMNVSNMTFPALYSDRPIYEGSVWYQELDLSSLSPQGTPSFFPQDAHLKIKNRVRRIATTEKGKEVAIGQYGTLEGSSPTQGASGVSAAFKMVFEGETVIDATTGMPLFSEGRMRASMLLTTPQGKLPMQMVLLFSLQSKKIP